MGIDFLVGLIGPYIAKIGLALGAILALLGYGWKKKREGRLQADAEAKAKERLAYEDVARLRGGDKPSPWGGGVRRADKPFDGTSGPPKGDSPGN